MTARRIAFTLAAFGLLAAVGYGFYTLGMTSGMKMAAPATPPAGDRTVAYWYDPMKPEAHFDQPGKSPFMDMQLVPRYAEDAGGARDSSSVRIDPSLQQNLGVRTALATRGTIQRRLEAVGNVAYDERHVAVVQARANGFLERLYVRAVLDPVRQGQPLAELYVPDWVAAQEEWLAVRRMGNDAPRGLLEAATQRMRLAGMSDAQVATIEHDGKAHPRLTVTAPIDGVVSELAAREGMTVTNGAALFRINGVATVWVNADVPEAMAQAVRPGSAAEVTAAAWPGESFAAKVTAILPQVDPATRTLKARLEVANPKQRLVPGMFARVSLEAAGTGEALLVPSEAVIRTGKRNLVMVAGEAGRFTPVEVEVGAEGDGKTEIRRGLQDGQKIVVSGQFLVDSEASLKGVGAPSAAPPSEGAR